MLAANTSHNVLQISWVVSRHKKRNLDILFPLKLRKWSMSFGYIKKMLSWALIVDPVEMTYSSSEKKLPSFCRNRILCSTGTIIKYKSFYITAPTEREKESWLCKNCLNTHILLVDINNFWRAQKLTLHASITDFLNDQALHGHRTKCPECCDISFFLFLRKQGGNLFQKWNRNSCERVAHIDKTMEVKEVA